MAWPRVFAGLDFDLAGFELDFAGFELAAFGFDRVFAAADLARALDPFDLALALGGDFRAEDFVFV